MKKYTGLLSFLCAGILFLQIILPVQAISLNAGVVDEPEQKTAEEAEQEPEQKTADKAEQDPEQKAQPVPKLWEDGDVVGFIGDSITHVEYTPISYPEFLYNYYLSRFPEKTIELRNIGVSSYRAGDILDIYDRDQAFKGLNHAVIMLGMNEALQGISTETYITNMGKIVERLKTDGLKGEDIIVLSPTPYDQTCAANLDAGGNPRKLTDNALTEYTEQLAAKTAEWGVCYVDLHTPMNELTKEIQKDDNNQTLTVWDCVHPSAMGEMLMAWYILKAQGAEPYAYRVSIPTEGEPTTDRARVWNLYRGDHGLCMEFQAESLPMAYTYEFGEFGQWFDLVSVLNQAPLQVDGLKKDASYTVTMDEWELGTFTGSELEKGINTAILENNPLQQVMQSVESVNQKWHPNAAEYRKIVRFATMAEPTHTLEQMQEAYALWKTTDADLRKEMYEMVRAETETVYVMSICEEGTSPEELSQEAQKWRAEQENKEAAEPEEAPQETAETAPVWPWILGAAAVIIVCSIVLRLLTGKRK